MLEFLKRAAEKAVERLAKSFVNEVAEATRFTAALEIKVRALVSVFRGLKMAEELNCLFLLVTAECGRMGIIIPEAVSKMFASVPAPVSAPAPKSAVTPASVVVKLVKVSQTPALVARVPPPSGDFGAKLNGAAIQLGLADKSSLGLFREALGKEGRGKEYWDRCREVTSPVLLKRLIKDRADWELLAGKVKHNPFFANKGHTEAFVASCPKDILAGLVTSQDALPELLGRIRQEEVFNPASPNRLAFIMKVCQAVGEEAKPLLTNCKHAVNRMKQRGFIATDHWLVEMVAETKATRIPIPESKYAAEVPTAAEAPAEKAECPVDPEFERKFGKVMMEAAGETPVAGSAVA